MQVIESQRLEQIRQCLQTFCGLENELILKKQVLLLQLESSITAINSNFDLNLFINQNKACEVHHKYSKALGLLDADYKTRHSDIYEDQKDYPQANFHNSKSTNTCNNLKNLNSNDFEYLPPPSEKQVDQGCTYNSTLNDRESDDLVSRQSDDIDTSIMKDMNCNTNDINCNRMKENSDHYYFNQSVIDNHDHNRLQDSDRCNLRRISSASDRDHSFQILQDKR